MANVSVDSFIRIFKFYQDNPLVKKVRGSDGKIKSVTLHDIFKENSLIYHDTVDVYLHSLTLDKLTQLSYDTDSDTVQHALNAREKLSKYFSKVLYPGSYAYSTTDNAIVRRMLLDWSSSIKTIQDANRKVTNAYSLSTDDVDKAIRGFGIDFVNSTTIKSLERRKNFLLKICELYSIKGTPDSIIKALNIIGLDDIFIREAWICKDPDKYNGDYDLKIQWKAQKLQQEFDSIQNTYVELNTHEDIFTTWDWFQEKIVDNKSTFDPHWFYTDSEIKIINNKPDTFIKLPSITPYFGIEFVSDLDRNIDSLEVLFDEINKEYQQFFMGESDKAKTIWVDTFPNRINVLECYTGLLYTLIRADENLQYENFRSYLLLNKFEPPKFEGPYEYFKLINWVYQHRDDGTLGVSYQKLLDSYIPIKSNSYTSYENVLRWWLEEEVTDSEKRLGYSDYSEELVDISFYPVEDIKIENHNVADNIKHIGKKITNSQNALYIQPRKVIKDDEYSNFITLEWDNAYPFGRYCVESYNKDEGWKEIVSNAYIFETTMQCSVLTDYAEHGSDDIGEFRIVIYHHPGNIPELFFHQPFNFNAKPTNTLLDRVIRYNGAITTIAFYDNDDPIKQAFINQQIPDSSTAYDVASGYHEQEASGNIRVTQIHDNIKAYYSSAYNYPSKTKLYEDKWMNINSTFYNYVDWATVDYYDTISHNGQLESNYVENKKWPINKKWNWAIDSKYYYICYEANKWMRYPISGFVEKLKNSNSGYNYGDRVVSNGILYVYVAVNKWAIIPNIELKWNNNESDLTVDGKIKGGSRLSRTLAVGQIKSDTIISLLYKQTTSDKFSEEYKESQRQLNQSTIEIYTEPYGNQLVTTNSYTYNSFLLYLYNNRLTLDFSNGYIYPVIDGHVDDHCRIYLKCEDESRKNTIWIRFNNQKDNIWWDNCEGCESIYNDDIHMNLMLPPYSLPNRYDSLRMLEGRTFNYRKELLEAFENGQISDDINLVVVRAYNRENAGKYEETESKYMINHPVVYKKIQVITSSGSLKVSYDWVPIEVNRIQDCKIGINPDLLDWIDTMLETNPQNYIDLPSIFSESLNSYLINDLGIENSVLDLIIASWSNSAIVKKLINFYKPKRARLLFISDALDSDYTLSNGVDSIGITDHEYNYYDLVTYRWGNPNFDSRNLSKINRQRISHVIHDYMPVEDTIYKDSDDSNKIFNYRELYSSESKIPEIEVYDELVDITRQSVATRNGTAYAVFYAYNLPALDDTTDSMDGFYYQISLGTGEKIYSNNSWYFQQCQFVTRFNDKGRIKITTRWAIFPADQNICEKEYAYYVADKESQNPWIADDGTPIKYANCHNTDKLLDELLFEYGNFVTDRFVKVNVRTISPVLYFRCFTNEACNGFYYYNPVIHPDRNGNSVFYNLKGKMISLVDTSSYYTRQDPVSGKEISKFWCISDYRQIVDFNECDYFAYAVDHKGEENLSLWDDINGLNNFTKEFYRYDGSIEPGSSFDHPSALVGCSINFLYDHQEIIRDIEGVYSAKYDIYENFRRNHVNTVGLEQKPIACITSDGISIINYYNDNDENKKIHYGDDKQIDSNVKIDLTIDDIGNATGAIKIRSNVVFRSKMNNSDYWTISTRLKFIDSDSIANAISNVENIVPNKWYMITYTSENKLFIDGKLQKDGIQNFIEKGRISFNDINCDIAELGIWDSVLDKWYINAISNFRILRNRPETNKSKTAVGASNYRPLYGLNNKPIAYITSDGITVINYYNHNDENKKIHYGDDKQIDSNTKIDLTIDDIGNATGAIKIRSNVVLRSKMNNSDHWTISARLKFIDSDSIINALTNIENIIPNQWYMITYTSENELFINGKLQKDGIQNFIEKGKVRFDNINCDIAELGIWDSVLDKWYINVISNFRILRNRPETNKSKTGVGFSNYRPLYAVEQPRIVYDRWSTGMPENTVGGRLDEYFADKYKKNHEENPLWVNRIPHQTEKDLIVKGAAYNQPTRDTITIGNELESSSDYITPDGTIQWWWMRYNKDFRTGPIHHRPLYVSAKQIINDPYPVIKHGQEKRGDYFDIGLTFDGVDNIDNSCYNEGFIEKTNANTFDDETYDENTGFGFKSNNKVKLENYGDTYQNEGSLNNTYILDLAQLELTSEDFRNFMFHNTLYLYNMPSLYNEFNGIWIRSTTVNSWREGDFKQCYTKDYKFEAVFTYNKETGYFWWEIRKLNDENVWETYFRTYVNAKHNQSRSQYVYDLLNYHQIDLSNQKLCKFYKDEFVGKCWSQVKQEDIGTSFGSNHWARFNIAKSNEYTHPGCGNYFDGYKYHITINDKWYTVDADSEFKLSDRLPEYKTPSGYMFSNNYLYIWVDDKSHNKISLSAVNANADYTYSPCINLITKDSSFEINVSSLDANADYGYSTYLNLITNNTPYSSPSNNDIINLNKIEDIINRTPVPGWIRIRCSTVYSVSEKIPNDLWKFRKTSNNIVVNVIDSSKCIYPEESFINPDIIDIRETMWKLVKYNGVNDWKWEEHMNEEFAYLKSVNNDISLSIASIQDTLWYQTFEINSVGEYIKVQHSNGIIDFVKEMTTDDTRVNELRYTKILSESNV